MFEIRKATQGQYKDLAAIHLASLTYAMPEMPRIHTVEEDLHFFSGVLTNQECWVAEVEGSVVGFIAVHDSWVHHLYLLPRYHRMGIGGALLNRAKKISPFILQLWTFQGNLQARAFYAKHGFVEVEMTNGEGNQERTPDVRMVWN